MTKNAGQFQNTQSGVLSNKIYYRLNGEQFQKAYPALITNPRTYAQMAVRVALANINNLFRVLASGFPITFQNRKKAQTINNCFTSVNKNIVPVYLNKSESALKYCIITEYIISRGTLQPFKDIIHELTEIGEIHLWGFVLEISDYSGSNINSLRNAMKKTFSDFTEKEVIHIALLYGPANNVQLKTYKISFSENSLPPGITFRDDGFLYIEVSDYEWLIAGCVFMRRKVDNSGHIIVSSQKITVSNGFMPPAYKRATLPFQEAAIISYQ